EDLVRRVQAVAASEQLTRMAAALSHASGESASYFDLARLIADGYQLDFLELVDGHGIIISSAQWPAKFGYPESGFESLSSATEQSAFLKQEEMQDSTSIGLFAVRTTRVGDNPVYIIGGRKLEKSFLAGLDLPADMRALLYQNRGERFSPDLLVDSSAGGNSSDG